MKLYYATRTRGTTTYKVTEDCKNPAQVKKMFRGCAAKVIAVWTEEQVPEYAKQAARTR